MFHAHMSVERVFGPKKLPAHHTVVSPRLDVFGLNVIFEVG